MRIRIACFALLSVTYLSCYSQNLEIELILRPSLTSMRGDNLVEENFDPAFRLCGGIGSTYKFSNRTFLSLALLYDAKGGEKELTIFYNSSPDPNSAVVSEVVRNESIFKYLTLPIQFGKEIGTKVKFEFGLGVYTSVLLDYELLVNSEPGDFVTKEDFKGLDFGLSGSVNVKLPINEKFYVKFGLNNNLGLADVSSATNSNNGGIKHNSFGVALSAGLKLK